MNHSPKNTNKRSARAPAQSPSARDPVICFCNSVRQSTIEAAMGSGCTTLGRLFDQTLAGVGPCGGTCQPVLRKMLEAHAQGQRVETPARSKRKSK